MQPLLFSKKLGLGPGKINPTARRRGDKLGLVRVDRRVRVPGTGVGHANVNTHALLGSLVASQEADQLSKS